MGVIAKTDLDTIRHTLEALAKSINLEVLDAARQNAQASSTVPSAHDGAAPGTANRLTVALAWVHARDARDRVLGPDLFADPAWNILLDLYIAHCRKSEVSVSSLCVAAQVPPTTALRWIALLERRGLLQRTSDPFDRRRSLVSITDDVVEKMEATLDRASAGDRKLGLGRLQVLQ